MMTALAQLDWRRLTLLAMILAAATLGAALISQFVFGLAPCPLCIYQRWPYVVGVAALGAALAFGSDKGLAMASLGVAALAFDVGIGLGVWHSGVEFGWFPAPDCQGGVAGADAGVEAMFEGALPPACDARAPFFLWLSMANWNVLVSIALGGLVALALLDRLGARLAPQR